MNGVEEQQDEVEVFGRCCGHEGFILSLIFGFCFEAMLHYRVVIHGGETTTGQWGERDDVLLHPSFSSGQRDELAEASGGGVLEGFKNGGSG